MAIAKVFRSGNSQVVQLPEELQFALDTEEVEAHRVGDRIVLELVQSVEWPESFWRAFGGVTEDFARPPQVRQEREALDGGDRCSHRGPGSRLSRTDWPSDRRLR